LLQGREYHKGVLAIASCRPQLPKRQSVHHTLKKG